MERFRADVNVLDSAGQSPLHYVVLRNQSHQCVRRNEDFELVALFLLERNTHVNQQNRDGKTALHMAARNNFPKIVEMMFMHGANGRLLDNNGKTACECIPEFDAPTIQIFQKYLPLPSVLLTKCPNYEMPNTDIATSDLLLKSSSDGDGIKSEDNDGQKEDDLIGKVARLNSCIGDRQTKIVVQNSIPLRVLSHAKKVCSQEKMVLSDGRTIFHTSRK